MNSPCRGDLVSPLQPVFGEDGSQSFFNTTVNEAYHSKIGPITEA